MLNNNIFALIITFIAALAWLRINDFFAHRGWVPSHISRKIIHIGTGPVFVVCWLLFTDAPSSRYLAALVPLAITAQFVLVGTGVIKDEAAVKALSRTGDRREILYGPMFYGIIFVLLTIIYWIDSPIGMIALMVLCGGDGLADIVGRKFGNKKLPWSKTKSYAGALAMFAGSLTLSFLLLWVFTAAGVFSVPISSLLLPLAAISLGATIVEALPIKEVDNITITIASLALAHLLI
jgi:phytol kinase